MQVLWIDGVGGFAVCESPCLKIGSRLDPMSPSVAIAGDLPRQAIALRRVGEDYSIEPLEKVVLNGLPVNGRRLIADGDRLGLGGSVEIRFEQPTPLSGTARLSLISRHRWHSSVDGVVLVAGSCLLGPSRSSHIPCPSWKNSLVLFRHQGQWMVRVTEYRDGIFQSSKKAEPLVLGRRLIGDEFSMTLLEMGT